MLCERVRVWKNGDVLERIFISIQIFKRFHVETSSDIDSNLHTFSCWNIFSYRFKSSKVLRKFRFHVVVMLEHILIIFQTAMVYRRELVSALRYLRFHMVVYWMVSYGCYIEPFSDTNLEFYWNLTILYIVYDFYYDLFVQNAC